MSTIIDTPEPITRYGEMTLVELATEVERRKDAARDIIAPVDRLSMFENLLDNTLRLSADMPDGVDHFGVNDHCHGQIATYLGIPKAYYDRMRVDAPGLLERNVNHWLPLAKNTKGERDARMVRTLDGNARAFLSNSYRRLDNFDLLNSVLPILSDVPDLTIHQCALTETSFYLKAVFPRTQAEVKVGDIVQSGILIQNSEVGSGRIAVFPFMFRLVCLNGMTSKEYGQGRRHVGRRIGVEDEAFELYSDATLALDDKAFFAKVKDIVRAATRDEMFNQIVSQCRELAELRIDANPLAAVKVLSKGTNITEGESENVLRFLTEGGDLSAWGYVNAVTAAARDTEDIDRKVELEKVGGTLAASPASWWKNSVEKVAAAA